MSRRRRQVADESEAYTGPDSDDLHRLQPGDLEVAHMAAEQIIKYRLYLIHEKSPGKSWREKTASDLVAEYVGTKHGNSRWHLILTVADDLAKTDRRYFGVRDPQEERYCSACRQVHPISAFQDENIICQEAQNKEE